MAVHAVTFDYWNTLVIPDDARFRTHRLAALHRAIADHRAGLSLEAVQEAASGLVDLFNEHWAQNQQFTADDAVRTVLDRLGVELGEREARGVAAAFANAIDEPPSLAPGVVDAIDGLRAAGIRIGIVCDVGMTPSAMLRRYLDAHGVLDRFDHWSFSDEVGVYKPHPEIFEHALGGLGGIEPASAAHVGDLRRTDVAGARAVGMLAVRYRASHDDEPDPQEADAIEDADHVIDDHGELPAVLGLG